MSFVSPAFFAFFLVFFILYYSFPDRRAQNLLIVAGSYFFYGWWDWRFLILLLGITVVNFAAALAIAATASEQTRYRILFAAVSVSIAALVVFKYANFFVQSFIVAVESIGIPMSARAIEITLPLGISFITFQGIAYVVDVYRGTHKAEPDFIKFMGFKAFFPQLVAGPIERASNLLDQFDRQRTIDIDKVSRAIWLLVYGYFLKIVVADSMAPIVDSLFATDQPFGWSVVLGTLAFGVQIYGDFWGYSLIAKGAALLLGFDLIWNFRFPYWAISISDFWRRWHISLSTWLRDYLYVPLGGNRGGTLFTVRNLLLTMGLGGLWHGAAWNFVLWGLLHGVALATWRFLPVPLEPRSRAGRAIGWAVTMIVVFVGWFLFRATSYELMAGMTAALFNWNWAPVHLAVLTAVATVAFPVALIEWAQLRGANDYFMLTWPTWQRYLALSLLTFLCLVMMRDYRATFIYFQF